MENLKRHKLQNLTLLESTLIKLDEWQLSPRTEKVLHFICFVFAPAYILFHLVRFVLGV